MAELTTLARPYAKAAFESALADNALAEWSKMLSLAAAVAQQPKVEAFIVSPAFTAEHKAKTFIEICGEELNGKCTNLIATLADYQRLPILPEILQQFELLKAQREKSVDVVVTTAYELSDDIKANLVKALSAKLERDVNVTSEVDQAIIGGALVRAGDTVIDGSVRGRLTKLAEAMNS